MTLPANWIDDDSGTLFHAANQNAVETAVNTNTTTTNAIKAVNGVVKSNGSGTFSAAVSGTDYVAVGGALGTPSSGNLANCTFPTLNQNTTGSAASLTTARTVQTNLASTSSASFNGTAGITPGVTGTLPVANGGTGAVTLTGLVKGSGTSAFVPAVAGTDYVAPSAVVDNSDGTLSINTTNTLEPLSVTTIYTASTTPVIGQTSYYNATSGNLTPMLPALSGLRVGARLAVRRDPADVSFNTVTLTCAGSDTFYSSSATTTTLPISGEQREYQVISVTGTKYWAPSGSVNPIASMDQRYLGGASKLVSIGDNGFGTSVASSATSTAGTSRMVFTVGVASTDITAQWNHWYTTVSGTLTDTDPSGAIIFNASLEVVSSTNPGTVTGTIYRLTFNGRTTATLDPGGRVVADVLGINLAAGDVVAVRTYLSSGTAYSPRTTWGPNAGALGGFTSSGDLTAPGSAAISGSTGLYYGPSALLGYPVGAAAAKSVLLLGDSIAAPTGDMAIWTRPALATTGGFVARALSGVAGLTNLAVSGDAATYFQANAFRRLSNAPRCNSAIIEYGINDFVLSLGNAAQIEAVNLNLATYLRRLGIAKVVLTTLCPRTSSTDGWATTTNQTPVASGAYETNRIAYNTWVRAQCPISATTLAPVAVGTSGALLAGSFGHPITGIFDTCATVESSLNSGLWLPCNRVATGSITTGTGTLSSSTANFLSANQEAGGDKGTVIALLGAGAAGATLYTNITSWISSTSVTIGSLAGTTVSNAQLNIGIMTQDGMHPSAHGHYLMSQAINTAVL